MCRVFISGINTRQWVPKRRQLELRRRGITQKGTNYTIFIFTKMSTLILGPTKPPIRWVLALFPWGTVMGQEADLSPPSSAQIRIGWSCISTLVCAIVACRTRTSHLPLTFQSQGDVYCVTRSTIVAWHTTQHATPQQYFQNQGQWNGFYFPWICTSLVVISHVKSCIRKINSVMYAALWSATVITRFKLLYQNFYWHF